MNKEYTFRIPLSDYKAVLKNHLSELQESLHNSSISFTDDSQYLLVKSRIFSLTDNKPRVISDTERLLDELCVDFKLSRILTKL